MYLHDVAYSHCGRRLATCGSDQRITVWNKCSSSGVAPGSAAAATVAAAAAGGWTRAAAWAAHCGPVWRVAWAPPAFGAILASASADHTVLLWEECVPASASAAAAAAAGGGAAPAPVWQQRAQLNDARGGVRAVCWAPRHLGLRLAAGSADGGVRVYEAVDAAASLAHWSLDAFDAEPEAAGGVAALAWATGPADAPLIAVGGGSGVTKIWGWATAARRWLQILELRGHTHVQDIAWAPAVGRAYHLVATCGAEGAVAVWRLQHEVAGGGGAGGGGGETERAKAISAPAAAAGAEPWSVRRLAGASTDAAASLVAAFADHAAPVWRVDWNIFGTVLASTGNDGVLRLRRQVSGGSGEWETAADVPL